MVARRTNPGPGRGLAPGLGKDAARGDMTSALSPDCLGEFRPDVASKWFVHYGLHSPYVIEAAAKRAAKLVDRPLLAPMTRSPWEAMPGDRSIVWRLGGEPAMVVKVCATNDPTTARMWT